MKAPFLLLLLLLANLSLGADRVALVVGNSAYPGKSDTTAQAGDKMQLIRLDGVEKDRALMASSLREVGFVVVEKANLRTKEMQTQIAEFARQYHGVREVLFYFSGHGAQVDGDSYLAGIDTDPDLTGAALELEARFSGEELDRERAALERKMAETRSVPLRQVLANLQLMTPSDAPREVRDRHVRIVVVDACRSPFGALPEKTRGKGAVFTKGGLANPPGRAGMFIGFAAGAGEESVALPAAPSVFTQQFAARLRQPGNIQQVFLDTRNAVSKASNELGFPMKPAYTDELNPGSTFEFTAGSGSPANSANAEAEAEIARRVKAELARLESSKPSMPQLLVSPPTPQVSTTATPEPKMPGKDRPFVNSLGMKFVPVPGTKVLFSIWETRVQDYDVFAKTTSRPWEKPPFPQGSTHPAVRISWSDATAFCEWLTEREHRSGALGADSLYRLPTDLEWSSAVGLGEEYGDTPALRDSVAPGFPWGDAWPPPRGAGNYDQSVHTDSFPYTSPVGSFQPNRLGLFDLGGNAYEWVQDFFDQTHSSRTVRGASWADGAEALMSSTRYGSKGDVHFKSYGFRCVIGKSGK